MIFSWDSTEGAARFASATGHPGVTLRLVVEQSPVSDDWDWAVWDPGTTKIPPRTGMARSASLATADAEAAAANWTSGL